MAFGTQLQLNTPPEPSSAATPLPESEAPLELLPAIEPGAAAFFRNLKDFLLLRDWPRPFDRRPYDGWQTAYVFTNAPWRRIRESWWGHALLAVATFAVCTSPIFLRAPVKPVSPFEHAHIEYYPVSDYLPPINNTVPRAHAAKKADPVFAKQEIISVRPNADNHTQTIITPPQIKLQHDVPLPNLAVWTADPIAPTVAAPAMKPKIVFPVAAQVVEPTPDVNQLRDKRSVNLQSSAVEPVASDPKLRAGQLNIANLRPDVVPPAPALPVSAQRASGIVLAQAVPPAPKLPAGAHSGASVVGGLHPEVIPPRASAPAIARRGIAHDVLQPQVVPPQPNVGSVPGANAKATGQIIALSVHPADVHGPINIPAGNRNGEFYAGPQGKPGATGQPDASPNVKGSKDGAGNGVRDDNGPAGVYVGAPPANATSAPVIGKDPRPAPSSKEMAKLQFPNLHASVAELAKATHPSATPPADRNPVADKVFGAKRYYSLTLNMPNLNSATGSWVVHFAELNDRHDGIPVLAPVATNKLDPVYPEELVRDRVEGTVTLYAVIRRDGTVAEIRVLHSVDKSLDYCAMRALAGWRFLPGTKNGNAVDLEAIVDIPFRLRSLPQ